VGGPALPPLRHPGFCPSRAIKKASSGEAANIFLARRRRPDRLSPRSFVRRSTTVPIRTFVFFT
jgi:hypothetical protein